MTDEPQLTGEPSRLRERIAEVIGGLTITVKADTMVRGQRLRVSRQQIAEITDAVLDVLGLEQAGWRHTYSLRPLVEVTDMDTPDKGGGWTAEPVYRHALTASAEDDRG